MDEAEETVDAYADFRGVFCNIEWFVKAEQYLFESLWKKVVPAKKS